MIVASHSANILETNNLPGWDTSVKKYQTGLAGFQIGLIGEIPMGIKGLFFQPAFTYITKGRKYNRNNDSLAALATDTIYNKSSLVLGYIEIPLNITYKLPITADHKTSLIFSAGPYFSFFNNGHLTTESLTLNPQKYSSTKIPLTVGKGSDAYQTTDIGISGRIGIEVGQTMITGYYSRGLTNFYTAPYTGTFHHQIIGLCMKLDPITLQSMENTHSAS